jgi:hypothetical protein
MQRPCHAAGEIVGAAGRLNFDLPPETAGVDALQRRKEKEQTGADLLAKSLFRLHRPLYVD